VGVVGLLWVVLSVFVLGVVLAAVAYRIRRSVPSEHQGETAPGAAPRHRGEAEAAAQPVHQNEHALKLWFEGKHCALCSRLIPPVHAGEPKPGVLDPDTGQILGWDELLHAEIPEIFEGKVPLCDNCVVVERFRRQFPALVTDAPTTDSRE
jgi:hypothetical protein